MKESTSNHSNKEELLNAWLQNKLSPAQAKEVERLAAEDPFFADAMQGLKQIEDTAKVSLIRERVDVFLLQKLRQKKAPKNRSKILHMPLWIVCMIVLILLAVVFIMIYTLKIA